MTPHIKAEKGDFAKTMLMPGDPKRAKFVADNFLKNTTLVNDVRGVQGYTGYYNGKRVSVMASGMGMPSIGIYSYELFKYFDVENIIRIGSAGAMNEKVKVRDIVLAMGASTDSNFAHQYGLPGTYANVCNYELLEDSVRIAKKNGYRYHVGNVLSSDVFYSELDTVSLWGKMGVLAVEMEAAALYMNAARLNKKALAILTVSDHLLTGESLSSEEREKSFKEMMTLALEVAQ